jgi:hypothetical protein
MRPARTVGIIAGASLAVIGLAGPASARPLGEVSTQAPAAVQTPAQTQAVSQYIYKRNYASGTTCWYRGGGYWGFYDSTYGALIQPCVFRKSSGAYYAGFWLTDTRADGRCARAAVEWRHVNGRSYYDPPGGTYVCGKGRWIYRSYSARNPNYYKWVRPCVWVSGRAATCGPVKYI